MTHLLSHLAPNMGEPLLTIEAQSFQSAISKHFGDLSVLLSVFSEDEFTLVILVFVLASSPVFTALIS